MLALKVLTILKDYDHLTELVYKIIFWKNRNLKLMTLTGDAGAQGIIRQNPDLNGISIIYEDRKAFLILIQRKITNWREKEGYKNEHEDTGCKSLDSNRH